LLRVILYALVVTVFGPQGRLDARPEGPLARLVAQAATRLSGLLGGETNRT
jgi:hypothetical protein